MAGIQLGVEYTLADGTTFKPILKEKGKLIVPSKVNPWADRDARTETIYIDAQGKRVRKRVLTKSIHLKNK